MVGIKTNQLNDELQMRVILKRTRMKLKFEKLGIFFDIVFLFMLCGGYHEFGERGSAVDSAIATYKFQGIGVKIWLYFGWTHSVENVRWLFWRIHSVIASITMFSLI